MSMLYLASKQAMRLVRRRAPSPVSTVYAYFSLRPRVAFVLLKKLPCIFFDRMWDNPLASEGHQLKLEQAMFVPPYHGPFSTGGEQCGSQKWLLCHPGSSRRGCYSIPIIQRTYDQGRLSAEDEQEASCSIRSQPMSSLSPTPKVFDHEIGEGRTQ